MTTLLSTHVQYQIDYLANIEANTMMHIRSPHMLALSRQCSFLKTCQNPYEIPQADGNEEVTTGALYIGF